MPTIEERIAKAQELLTDPKLSPEKASELKQWVNAQYASGAAQRPGGLGSATAPSGVQAYEQKAKELPSVNPEQTTQETKDAEQKQERKTQLQEFVREGRPKVEWDQQGPGAVHVREVLQQQAGGALEDPAKFAKKMEQAEALERQANQSLKNLSKDPALFVPPEHWSEQARLQPGIKDALPGIGHEVWDEPSIQMFRRDMSPMLKEAGLDPEKIDESDPLFHRYADAMWGQRYKRAAEKGESVVRRSMMKGALSPGSDAQLPGEVDQYGLAVMSAIPKFIYGLDLGRSFGLATEVANNVIGAPPEVIEDQRNMRETGWGQLGQLAGAVLPGGGVGGITGGLSRLMPQGGAGANIGRGIGIGALGGAGVEGIQDAVQVLGDVSRGAEPSISLEQVGSDMLSGGLAGGLAGGLFSGVSELARAGKDRLLKSSMGKDVATMEEAGIEPGIFRSEPANVKAARQRTADARLGGDVKSMASKELGQPLARAWRDVEELGAKGELPRLRQQADEYFRSPEGAKKVPINNTAAAVVDLLESRTGATGEDLPFMLNMEKFKKVREQLFETKQVTGGEASRFAEGGWRVIPSDSPSGMVTIARPRQLDARELSTVVDQLDDLAGFTGKELTGPKEKAFRLFSAAVRKDRDKFGQNRWTRGEGGGQLQMTTPDGQTVSGFSALMGRLSEAKRGSSKLLEEAGLNKGAPGLKSQVAEVPELPTSVTQLRKVDKTVADLEELDVPDLYDPTGSSPRSLARRAVERRHRQHIEDEVTPALGKNPDEIEAIQMFSLGYDQPIRMVQRGMSPEEATRRYYDPKKTDLSPHEFTKRLASASAHIEGALAKAPKATHVPVVYRGMVLNDFQIDRMLEEGSFNNGGMVTSFTRNPLQTTTFGGGRPGTHVILKVKHKNGVGIETISEIPQEQEVLLPGTSSFKITDAYRIPRGNHIVIEAEELGASTVGKAPKARSAVKEGLTVEPTEAQNKQLDKLVQNFRQQDGSGRSEDAAREIARIAGVEEELKMWAGIMAANRVAGGAREGVALGGGGIRGFLGGSLPQLAVRSTKTLNRLGAEPLAHAPEPSVELRALLKRLRGRGEASGPPAFSLMGMGSGGPPVASALTGQERESEGLDPALRLQVMGKEHLRDQAPPMTTEEAGWLQQLAEAYLRSSGQSMPMQPPQAPPAPQAPIEEFQQ